MAYDTNQRERSEKVISIYQQLIERQERVPRFGPPKSKTFYKVDSYPWRLLSNKELETTREKLTDDIVYTNKQFETIKNLTGYGQIDNIPFFKKLIIGRLKKKANHNLVKLIEYRDTANGILSERQARN